MPTIPARVPETCPQHGFDDRQPDAQALSPHLRRELELVPVSEWANNARHDDQRCLEPR